MRRWLAIGAVVGFTAAVLLIAVLGGPGDQPAAAPPPVPVVAAPLDAGPAVLKAIDPVLAIPNAADRRLGAMGPSRIMERPRAEPARDAGP